MTVLSVITSYAISIHALREESDGRGRARVRRTVISIHALREESDPRADQSGQRRQISIHALREESDLQCLNHRSAAWLFQSTLSVRRATTVFNHLRDGIGISIHALREESDSSSSVWNSGEAFQSTLSVRRATAYLRSAC